MVVIIGEPSAQADTQFRSSLKGVQIDAFVFHPPVVLSGRHSTALQNASSSEDQIASCMKLVSQLDGSVVQTYLDPAESGYKRGRPALKKLLRHLETGEVDIVICEALDRLARDSEDLAFLGKKLNYHGVELYTVTEGHVGQMKMRLPPCLAQPFSRI